MEHLYHYLLTYFRNNSSEQSIETVVQVVVNDFYIWSLQKQASGATVATKP